MVITAAHDEVFRCQKKKICVKVGDFSKIQKMNQLSKDAKQISVHFLVIVSSPTPNIRRQTTPTPQIQTYSWEFCRTSSEKSILSTLHCAPQWCEVKLLLPGKQNNDLWNQWSCVFCVFCSSVTTAAVILLPVAELNVFDLHQCSSIFHTSPALSHFRLPPSSHIHTLHMGCTHTHTHKPSV